jgi:hypothetical protein
VYAKLDWATSRHDEMLRIFEEFIRPGGGDERPYGIRFREADKPAGLVVAHFTVDESMPEEMSLYAADLVHNTRTALDHVLARLKDDFGGDPGQGSFPTWQTEELWQEKVMSAGKRSPVQGLSQPAVDLIYGEQPLHRASPADDPLVILNGLDNTDKHRELNPAFVYPGVDRGIDLIEVVDASKVQVATNLWEAGQDLDDGTLLARFIIRGGGRLVVRASETAHLGFATGKVGSSRTGYIAMINRVRGIANKAEQLIDNQS